jgi:DNA-binding response OmpR family regulator
MFDNKALYQQCKALSILFVEDYTPLRDKIVSILQDFFKIVISASDGQDGLEKYLSFQKEHGKSIDIVITDISMPHKNGLELSKDIQKINPDQVIAVISANQDSKYLIEFINMNIHQFMPKPVESERMLEVLYRLSKKVIEKNDPVTIDKNEILIGKNLKWCKEEKGLFCNDKKIKLTKYEFILMEYFVLKLDQICTFDAIISYFYEKNIDIYEENIRNMIARFRQKLPKNTIESIYGIGYRISK